MTMTPSPANTTPEPPVHYSNEEAQAWTFGYETAVRDAVRRDAVASAETRETQ